eukprot:403360932
MDITNSSTNSPFFMQSKNQKSLMSKSAYPGTQSTPNLQNLKTKANDIYRVSKQFKVKDEELPFTSSNYRPKKQIYTNSSAISLQQQQQMLQPLSPSKLQNLQLNDYSTMQNSMDILQKTYYNVAHPPNRKPLSKMKVQPSLATTNDIVANMNSSTKYCLYSEQFLKTQSKQSQLEDELNGDISKSIQRTSSVTDYYKNYGFFFLTKTSQNYANTINSLANYEKSKVLQLDQWYAKKIANKKNEGSDYIQAIQHDKTLQDPDLILKNKMIQQSEILEATNFQLKSVLKQKSEMFQPGKSIKLMALDKNLLTKKAQESVQDPKMSQTLSPNNFKNSLKSNTQIYINDQQINSDSQNLASNLISQQNLDATNSSKNSPLKSHTEEQEPILLPLTKKQMWEIKEKNTTAEVKLQYTIIKLDEKLNEMKFKLESLRIENSDLSEMIKSKYGQKLLQIRTEQEMQTQIYSEGLTEGSRSSKLTSTMQKKKMTGKVEDFMKIKAVRDQLNQKKEKINAKIAKCNERIQTNIIQIHMFEFEAEQIKKDIQSTRTDQVAHYRKLLKEGIDSRKDGLIWIVKAIWLLGYDINIADMPEYLDSEAIKFILEYGKLDIKRSELHSMLKDMKFKSRKDRIRQVMRNKSLGIQSTGSQDKKNQSPPPKSFGFFKKHNHGKNDQHHSANRIDIFAKKSKEEIMKQAKEKLHQMAQTIEVVNPSVEDNEDIDMLMQLYEEQKSHELSSNNDNDSDYEDLNEDASPKTNQMKKSLIGASNLDPNEGMVSFKRRESLINIGELQSRLSQADPKLVEQEIQSLEKRYNQLKQKMRKIKQEALERIGKEFLLNNYSKRFKVNQEVVLSAIVGEDKAKETMSLQLKKQDDYRRIVEKNKTFTFSSLRQSTTTVNRQTMNTLNKM